jgi:putrescine transport system permease protein
MAVFSAVRLGVKPEVNALATLLIVIVAVAVTGAGALVTRDQRRRSSAQPSRAVAAGQGGPAVGG